MGRARKQRRAAKQGGDGEGGEAPEPRVSRRKQRRLDAAAERAERDSRPSGLKEANWKLRAKYSRMTIAELEKLLEKYGDKPKFATKVRMINSVLKSKRKRLANAPVRPAEGEQPKTLPKRRRGLVGLVQTEVNLLRLKRKYGKGQ